MGGRVDAVLSLPAVVGERFRSLDATPFFHVRACTTMALIGARMSVSPNRSAIA